MEIDADALSVVFDAAAAEVEAFFRASPRAPLSRSLRRAQRRLRWSTDAERRTFAVLVYRTVARARRLSWRIGEPAPTNASSAVDGRALVAAALREAPPPEAIADAHRAAAYRDDLDAAPPHVAASLPREWYAALSAHTNAPQAAAAALLSPGPVTLRANRRHGDAAALQQALETEQPVRLASHPLDPDALVVAEGRLNVRGSALWQAGAYEVQDAGSQRIAACVEPRSEDTLLDYCAGRGGKALALAARHNPGRITIHDIDTDRLHVAAERLTRAGAPGVNVGAPSSAYDWVLVDAPCSESGTLRRGPDVMWRVPQPTAAYAEAQGRILACAAAHVRPGGRLVYATCSFLPEENEGVRAAFLRDFSTFAPEADAGGVLDASGQRRLWPHEDESDAFYIARFRRGGPV